MPIASPAGQGTKPTQGSMMKNQTLFSHLLVAVSSLCCLIAPLSKLGAQESAKVSKDDSTLSPNEILQQVEKAYASLSSYRDTGWTVHRSTTHPSTNTFTEVLGARTRYRVEITTSPHPSFQRTSTFWCDGLDHNAQHGTGPGALHLLDLSANLSTADNDTSIPGIYFLLPRRNIFAPYRPGLETELLRKPDETIGGESCYVVARSKASLPATIWVSKRDFLLRRCKTSDRIETHENIVINEQIQPADYLPLTAKLSP
jgi:outer membrane lipoprotein-sorting protein